MGHSHSLKALYMIGVQQACSPSDSDWAPLGGWDGGGGLWKGQVKDGGEGLSWCGSTAPLGSTVSCEEIHEQD